MDVQPEGPREGELITTNEECGCDKEDEDVAEEVTLTKTFTLKEPSEIF